MKPILSAQIVITHTHTRCRAKQAIVLIWLMFSLPVLAQDTLPTVQYSHIENKIYFEYLSPNPVSTSVDIGYLVAETDNAYIMLTNSTTGLSYNFVLNSTNSNQLIPVDQLPQGTYIVNLIANGEILDTKTLIKNLD